MSANTFNTTAKKRQKSADEIIAAEAKKEALRLKREAAVDKKMQALQAPAGICCTNCKKTLPADQFGKDKSRKSGIAARCKPCNRLHVKGLKGYEKQERDTSLTPPRQINVMQGNYVPERGMYYRNDGNKHIKSVGF